MNSELYRLLMEYDGLDDDFINRAFEIIMKEEKGLEPFVLDFDIKVEDNPRLGSYNNETRQILVNPENIKEFPDVSNKKLLALNVLRHEIEHARSLQRLYEFRSDIESTVVKYSLMEYAIDHRMAPITSFDQIDAFGMAYRKIENYQIDEIFNHIMRSSDCKYKNKLGQTALSMAKLTGNTKIAEKIESVCK